MGNNQKSAWQAAIISSFVHALVVLVILVEMIYVVPRYVKIWADFDLELPAATRILLGIISFLHNYLIVLYPVIMLALVGDTMLFYSLRAKKGKLYASLYSIAILCLLFFVALCILVLVMYPTIKMTNNM